jgi:hypothetical protein
MKTKFLRPHSSEAINAQWHITQILAQFFEQLSDDGKTYIFQPPQQLTPQKKFCPPFLNLESKKP